MPYTSRAFQNKSDELQDQLHTLAARDDLLTGKLVTVVIKIEL